MAAMQPVIKVAKKIVQIHALRPVILAVIMDVPELVELAVKIIVPMDVPKDAGKHAMGNVWVYARVHAPILQLQQQKTIQ